MGELWGYKYMPMPKWVWSLPMCAELTCSHVYCSDFHVWTFIYDVSGIKSVTFNYRLDRDGVNPIDDTSNEVYHSGLQQEPVMET